jgi:hypothetical protein
MESLRICCEKKFHANRVAIVDAWIDALSIVMKDASATNSKTLNVMIGELQGWRRVLTATSKYPGWEKDLISYVRGDMRIKLMLPENVDGVNFHYSTSRIDLNHDIELTGIDGSGISSMYAKINPYEGDKNIYAGFTFTSMYARLLERIDIEPKEHLASVVTAEYNALRDLINNTLKVLRDVQALVRKTLKPEQYETNSNYSYYMERMLSFGETATQATQAAEAAASAADAANAAEAARSAQAAADAALVASLAAEAARSAADAANAADAAKAAQSADATDEEFTMVEAKVLTDAADVAKKAAPVEAAPTATSAAQAAADAAQAATSAAQAAADAAQAAADAVEAKNKEAAADAAKADATKAAETVPAPTEAAPAPDAAKAAEAAPVEVVDNRKRFIDGLREIVTRTHKDFEKSLLDALKEIEANTTRAKGAKMFLHSHFEYSFPLLKGSSADDIAKGKELCALVWE